MSFEYKWSDCSSIEDALFVIGRGAEALNLNLNSSSKAETVTITTANATKLAEAIGNSVYLQGLSLVDCGLDAKTTEILVEGLQKSSSVESLNLSRNSIGNNGVEAVCRFLEANQTVKHLDLSDCELGSSAAGQIGDLLEVNHWIRSIVLDNNEQISSASVAYLFKQLKQLKTVVNLSLLNCFCDVRSASEVFSFLKRNQNVLSLGFPTFFRGKGSVRQTSPNLEDLDASDEILVPVKESEIVPFTENVVQKALHNAMSSNFSLLKIYNSYIRDDVKLILERNAKLMRNEFRSILMGDSVPLGDFNEQKVLVLGRKGSGKSTLVESMFGSQFISHSKHFEMQIKEKIVLLNREDGINYKAKEVNLDQALGNDTARKLAARIMCTNRSNISKPGKLMKLCQAMNLSTSGDSSESTTDKRMTQRSSKSSKKRNKDKESGRVSNRNSVGRRGRHKLRFFNVPEDFSHQATAPTPNPNHNPNAIGSSASWSDSDAAIGLAPITGYSNSLLQSYRRGPRSHRNRRRAGSHDSQDNNNRSSRNVDNPNNPNAFGRITSTRNTDSLRKTTRPRTDTHDDQASKPLDPLLPDFDIDVLTKHGNPVETSSVVVRITEVSNKFTNSKTPKSLQKGLSKTMSMQSTSTAVSAFTTTTTTATGPGKKKKSPEADTYGTLNGGLVDLNEVVYGIKDGNGIYVLTFNLDKLLRNVDLQRGRIIKMNSITEYLRRSLHALFNYSLENTVIIAGTHYDSEKHTQRHLELANTFINNVAANKLLKHVIKYRTNSQQSINGKPCNLYFFPVDSTQKQGVVDLKKEVMKRLARMAKKTAKGSPVSPGSPNSAKVSKPLKGVKGLKGLKSSQPTDSTASGVTEVPLKWIRALDIVKAERSRGVGNANFFSRDSLLLRLHTCGIDTVSELDLLLNFLRSRNEVITFQDVDLLKDFVVINKDFLYFSIYQLLNRRYLEKIMKVKSFRSKLVDQYLQNDLLVFKQKKLLSRDLIEFVWKHNNHFLLKQVEADVSQRRPLVGVDKYFDANKSAYLYIMEVMKRLLFLTEWRNPSFGKNPTEAAATVTDSELFHVDNYFFVPSQLKSSNGGKSKKENGMIRNVVSLKDFDTKANTKKKAKPKLQLTSPGIQLKHYGSGKSWEITPRQSVRAKGKAKASSGRRAKNRNVASLRKRTEVSTNSGSSGNSANSGNSGSSSQTKKTAASRGRSVNVDNTRRSKRRGKTRSKSQVEAAKVVDVPTVVTSSRAKRPEGLVRPGRATSVDRSGSRRSVERVKSANTTNSSSRRTGSVDRSTRKSVKRGAARGRSSTRRGNGDQLRKAALDFATKPASQTQKRANSVKRPKTSSKNRRSMRRSASSTSNKTNTNARPKGTSLRSELNVQKQLRQEVKSERKSRRHKTKRQESVTDLMKKVMKKMERSNSKGPNDMIISEESTKRRRKQEVSRGHHASTKPSVSMKKKYVLDRNKPVSLMIDFREGFLPEGFFLRLCSLVYDSYVKVGASSYYNDLESVDAKHVESVEFSRNCFKLTFDSVVMPEGDSSDSNSNSNDFGTVSDADTTATNDAASTITMGSSIFDSISVMHAADNNQGPKVQKDFIALYRNQNIDSIICVVRDHEAAPAFWGNIKSALDTLQGRDPYRSPEFGMAFYKLECSVKVGVKNNKFINVAQAEQRELAPWFSKNKKIKAKRSLHHKKEFSHGSKHGSRRKLNQRGYGSKFEKKLSLVSEGTEEHLGF